MAPRGRVASHQVLQCCSRCSMFFKAAFIDTMQGCQQVLELHDRLRGAPAAAEGTAHTGGRRHRHHAAAGRVPYVHAVCCTHCRMCTHSLSYALPYVHAQSVVRTAIHAHTVCRTNCHTCTHSLLYAVPYVLTQSVVSFAFAIHLHHVTAGAVPHVRTGYLATPGTVAALETRLGAQWHLALAIWMCATSCALQALCGQQGHSVFTARAHCVHRRGCASASECALAPTGEAQVKAGPLNPHPRPWSDPLHLLGQTCICRVHRRCCASATGYALAPAGEAQAEAEPPPLPLVRPSAPAQPNLHAVCSAGAAPAPLGAHQAGDAYAGDHGQAAAHTPHNAPGACPLPP